MRFQRIFWAIVFPVLLPTTLITRYISSVTATIRRVPQDYPTIQKTVNAAKAGVNERSDIDIFVVVKKVLERPKKVSQRQL